MYYVTQSSKPCKVGPVMLTVVGGIGVIGTGVLAATATPKALQRKQEAEEEKGAPLTTWESFKVMAPSYIPAAGVGITTIAAFGGAQFMNNRQQAKMAGLLAGGQQLLTQATSKLNRMKTIVKEKNPELAKELEVMTLDDEWNKYVKDRMRKFARAHTACLPVNCPEQYGEDTFFGIEYGNGLADENNHETLFFNSTPGDVITAFFKLNQEFAETEKVSFNRLLHYLHLPNTELGSKLFWDASWMIQEWGSHWIGFSSEELPMEDNVPEACTCTMINFHIPPLAYGYSDGMGIPQMSDIMAPEDG